MTNLVIMEIFGPRTQDPRTKLSRRPLTNHEFQNQHILKHLVGPLFPDLGRLYVSTSHYQSGLFCQKIKTKCHVSSEPENDTRIASGAVMAHFIILS